MTSRWSSSSKCAASAAPTSTRFAARRCNMRERRRNRIRPSRSFPGTRSWARSPRSAKRPATRSNMRGQELKIGDRVVMCPDILCGKCWYCRNTFGFPLCQNIKGYGNAFTCDDSPHLMGGWADYIYVRKDAFVFKIARGHGAAHRGHVRTHDLHLQSRQGQRALHHGRGRLRLRRDDRRPGRGSPRPPACAQSPADGRGHDHRDRPFRFPASAGEGFRRRCMSSA